MAAESYTGEAYCVKCKAKREFTGHVEETNGRRFAKGICPDVRHQGNSHPGQGVNFAIPTYCVLSNKTLKG